MSKGGSAPPEKGRSMLLEEGRCSMRVGSGGRFLRMLSTNEESLMRVADTSSSFERLLSLNNKKAKKSRTISRRRVADSCSLWVVPPAHCSRVGSTSQGSADEMAPPAAWPWRGPGGKPLPPI